MRTSQITTAENLGIIAHESGKMRIAAQSKELMEILSGRKVGETPEGEASSVELINAFYSGWDKAKRIMMKERFGI